MKSVGRLTLVLVLSGTAHVLPWVLWGEVGQQAAGGAGQEAITLAAAPENLGEIVDKWQESVAVQQSVSPSQNPSVMSPPPMQPRALPDPSLTHKISAMTAPSPVSAPQLDMRPPTPPKPKPVVTPKEVSKPPLASIPQQAEKAKGPARASDQSGVGKAKATTGNSTREASLLRQWGAAIRRRIEHQKRRAQGTGEIRLRLAVYGSGNLASVKIVGNSGPKVLGPAALNAVKRARLPKAPSGISQGPHMFSLSLRYEK